jgi:G3E family GTPase
MNTMKKDVHEEHVNLMPIPATVVAGFLGAGKTTLINHMLKGDHGLRIAVVVNDFGSINIDAELISDVGEGMVSLANGCICCVIRSDLISAVLKLADRPERPDHIVIESSGVADPASVVRAFMVPEIRSSVLLDGVITLVDAEQAMVLPDEALKLARAQVTGGDLIVLNKIDLVDDQARSQVRNWIGEIRPGVQILEAAHCSLPLEILLGMHSTDPATAKAWKTNVAHGHDVLPDGRTSSCHHDHHHDRVFDTWSYESDSPLQLGLLQKVLGHLPNTVYRAKGFVYAAEKPHRRLVLQLVGRRATLAVDGPWKAQNAKTRLVFISRHGTVNYKEVENVLNSSKVTVGTSV